MVVSTSYILLDCAGDHAIKIAVKWTVLIVCVFFLLFFFIFVFLLLFFAMLNAMLFEAVQSNIYVNVVSLSSLECCTVLLCAESK